MADYNGMKVPELKKLLQERSLTQAGNKADLIARLVENDKAQAKDDEPEAGKLFFYRPAHLCSLCICLVSIAPFASLPTSSDMASTILLLKDYDLEIDLFLDITADPPPTEAKKPAEDEIDYDDDDFPAPAKSPAKPAAAAAPSSPAETKKPAPAPTPAPVAAADPEATTVEAPAAAAEPTVPLTQNLPPTNAQTEAEKRAARAARFGIAEDKTSEEAQKISRAARFGLAADDVSALDNALPDRPLKRGRKEGEVVADEGQGKKQRQGAGRDAGNNRERGPRNGGGGNQRGQRRNGGGVSKEGAAPVNNGQRRGAGGASGGMSAADKAKLEARAKRFAAAT